jgi:hypothetical protein
MFMEKLQKIKVPANGERTFIVRKISENCRALWLDRSKVVEIKISHILSSKITERDWEQMFFPYVVDGIRCDNYFLERNFLSLIELIDYLNDGGRITNLDESCSVYVRLIDGKMRFNDGTLVDNENFVINHPTSWLPYYPSQRELKVESENLIKGLLGINKRTRE